jgi:TatD DNase family protein
VLLSLIRTVAKIFNRFSLKVPERSSGSTFDMYIDTHTHVDLIMRDTHASESSIIAGMKEHSIVSAVQVSTSADNLQWSYDFARQNRESGFLFTLGIHPSSLAGLKEHALLEKMLERAITSDPALLFGVGECGLDFFRMRQEKNHQIESFVHQIDLSKKYNLPLIIHIRDALCECFEILASHSPVRGILHCFPGSRADAKKALDLGFHISFAGNVTYRNASVIQETAAYVPLDRILIETDAPYLTPVPHRGKKNSIEYVVHTYEYVAKLKHTSIEALKQAAAGNFADLKSRK